MERISLVCAAKIVLDCWLDVIVVSLGEYLSIAVLAQACGRLLTGLRLTRELPGAQRWRA